MWDCSAGKCAHAHSWNIKVITNLLEAQPWTSQEATEPRLETLGLGNQHSRVLRAGVPWPDCWVESLLSHLLYEPG